MRKPDDHKFKVRHLLINHIDQTYHTKVVNLEDQVEILKKLKEFKKFETNVSSFAVRKEISNMEYIKSKISVVNFYEQFEETIRIYENSPDANPLSESEKRDA